MAYDTDQERMSAIKQSYRDLDINSMESELEAQRQIDYESGDFDETPDEDANVPDAMPLENAIDIQRVSKSPVFQNIFRALKESHADFVNKSKDAKATQDARTLNHQMGMGLEVALGVFTAILEESEARLKAATPAERRAMGKDANQFISDLIAPVAAPPTEDESPTQPVSVARPSSRVPLATVQSNTRAVQNWLKKNDVAKRNQ